MQEPSIAEIDPQIQSYHEEWQRNRHVIDGARSIRPNSHLYLPMAPGQTTKEYGAYVARVPFFPGASRTHQALLGLAFRKAATIKNPAGVADIVDTITAAGFTLEDLAEEVMSELLITNFVGLVVDYPIAPSGLTRANAIDLGYRPFVAIFRAESILGIETAVINNRQRVTRVRLLDDPETIRELCLDNGVYSITLHHLQNGDWVPDAKITPTKNGQSLDEIPFTLVSTKRGFLPGKAPLTDVCEYNIQHYLASANLATCHYFSSSPIYNIMGAEKADYSVAPGSIWVFKQPETETKILEYTGATIASLRDAVGDITEAMALVGSRAIATETKAGVESADALAIRRTSENATQSATNRLLSRKINDALAWVSWWLDLPEDAITYEANTDFNSVSLNHFDIVARMGLWQAGAISLDAFIDMLMDAEVLPETFDRELDARKIAEAMDAAPPIDTGPALEPLAPIAPAKPAPPAS